MACVSASIFAREAPGVFLSDVEKIIDVGEDRRTCGQQRAAFVGFACATSRCIIVHAGAGWRILLHAAGDDLV